MTTKILYFVCFGLLSHGSMSYADQAESEKFSSPSIRGIVTTQETASLGIEVSAKINSIPYKVGESFQKGDTLISFDCKVINAEASASYASFQASKAEYQSNLELQKNDAVGELEVVLSKARMDESKANWSAAKGRTQHCNLKAPFTGKVAAIAVNEHEISTPDESLMKIVGIENLELRFVVPSSWLVWLKKGNLLQFKIDETGKEYLASVDRIGAEVDAVSGTIEVYASFNDEYKNVLPGMSGEAKFNQAGS